MKFAKSLSVIAPLAALAVLSGCESGGASGASSAGVSNLVGQASPSASDGAAVGNDAGDGPGPIGSKPAVGESCVGGDADKICLAVHFVVYKDSSGAAVASEAQAATIAQTMSKLFSQCDIGFQIDSYAVVDPTEKGLAFGAASQDQVDQIRSAYGVSNELLSVTTGPWGTAVNGWTNMPGSEPYGAIMEASVVDYGGGLIYAHEFGHYLGLDHFSDQANLMDPVIYPSSIELTDSQCQTARATAKSYWAAMVRK